MDGTRRVVQPFSRCETRGNIHSGFSLHIESWRNNFSGCKSKRRYRTAADHDHKRPCRPARLASMAPLESGSATFQGSSQQRQKCSHDTHIEPRQYESGLFRFQVGPQMRGNDTRSCHFSRREFITVLAHWLPPPSSRPRCFVK